jgi:class 3 adenylate cyclase
LTIVRCEIVSTGALAATLDPEDWFETAAAFRNCCSQIVTRFGGSVAPAAGDDVIAWFGYPEASEFDAEYAIQAGLTLVRAVPKLRVGPKEHVPGLPADSPLSGFARQPRSQRKR